METDKIIFQILQKTLFSSKCYAAKHFCAQTLWVSITVGETVQYPLSFLEIMCVLHISKKAIFKEVDKGMEIIF